MKIYLDGAFVEKEDAKISVFDHGLLYGDGIFEGIRIYKNCVYRLDEHLERLEYSAKAILLNMPWSRQELSDLVCESCRVNGLSDGYIRLIVTRGPGSLGLSPNSCPKPSLIIIADKIALYPEECYTEGLKIVTVPTRRTNAAALNPGVKSLNYLNNIMAKVEAAQAGALEGILLNDQGNVAECTGDNIFIVHKGVIFTPHASNGALRGITRQAVIDLANAEGIEVKEVNLTRYEIWNADECFLTGTAAELIPVVGLDSRAIGDGKPGPITQKLHAAFHQEVSTHGTMI
ncbi:branched-chain-amino-acid transaminase [Pelagicoccus sp. NFK12]|uniref:Branched-chain-amino-acid aminotransferase n=1 Tax=Pelagicoccus enzymogenes TaxID=2773457 RepID=A0A927F788_9BACT|nr:branched-chain-amino-acid transaminase [Pelagicoccus enzymogenes]MBD5779260.1 branched-chain-amino-acid transaminase [Pelagicoccus enzymogenes]MDQ8198388.1 branched-chain-amino-acid transaminase [Pelagicoccus enzymogenes]